MVIQGRGRNTEAIQFTLNGEHVVMAGERQTKVVCNAYCVMGVAQFVVEAIEPIAWGTKRGVAAKRKQRR